MRHLVKLIEQAESTLTVYHGSDSVIERFSLDHLGHGNHEHGVGVYFAYSEKDARTYGQHVYRVTVNSNINLIPPRTPSIRDATKLIRLCPNLDERLSDWDEEPKMAMDMLISAVCTTADNYAEMIDRIWYELFRGHERFYLEHVVKITGYQGKIIHWDDDEPFLVLFDVDVITDVQKQ